MALPRRTLEYLQRGASEGMRNAELFDATCQFRDAGHPLEETEGQLLARALADGLTEAEARTTIRSVYARTSREPLGAGIDRANAENFLRATPTAVTGSGSPREIHDGIARYHRR